MIDLLQERVLIEYPPKPLRKAIRAHNDAVQLTALYNQLERAKHKAGHQGRFGYLSFVEMESLQLEVDKRTEQINTKNTQQYRQKMTALIAGQPIGETSGKDQETNHPQSQSGADGKRRAVRRSGKRDTGTGTGN